MRRCYVIIGNSAAGISAAETLRRLDGDGRIIMISEEPGPAYSRCLLPALLAGEKSAAELYIRPGDFYRKNRIITLFGRKAVGVDFRRKQVILEDGVGIGYDRLLIATGSSTAFPPVPGLEGRGLFGLRSLSDARQILARCGQALRVTILGAGLVGLEAASALARRGLEVAVVEKAPHILPQQFDPAAAGILARLLEAAGVRIIPGAGVREAAAPSSPGRCWKLVLDNGTTLEAELVIAATGIRPNVELAREGGVKTNRGILVDDCMQTSLPDVYAAGDVAETAAGLNPTWPSATAQGAAAASAMAGRPRPYAGPREMQNVVQFGSTPALALGITSPPDGSYEVFTVHRPQQNLYRKLVLKDGALAGVILVGDIAQGGILGALMRKKTDVRKFLKLILNGRLHFGHLQGAVG